MGIKINISNLKICDNAEVLNNAVISGHDDVEIGLHDLEINGQVQLLENLEINSILNQLNEKVCVMDKNTDEYPRIKEILAVKQWDKKKFYKCIVTHLSDFSKGVLASIVANCITKL